MFFMEKTKFDDHFVKFPYQKEIDDNKTNNGGIDLVKEPQRIDEITEVSNYPWLKKFIVDVNSGSGLFMTFGCDYGIDDKILCGYIEFSFRPFQSHDIKSKISCLDDDFYRYLESIEHPGDWGIPPVNFAKESLRWESSPLYIENQTYDKASVYFFGSEEMHCEWLLFHLRNFLVDYYPSLYPDII